MGSSGNEKMYVGYCWIGELPDLPNSAAGPSIRAWRKLVARGFVKRAEVEPLRRMGPARRWLLLQKVTHLVATEARNHGNILMDVT